MGDVKPSIFAVSIDFSTSHMFFPKLMFWFLLFLLLLIFVFYGIPKIKRILRGEEKIRFSVQQMDKLRFFGTLVLTVIYFLLMQYVGQFFPNTGMGFLLVSMPFIFLLSLLYSHGLSRSKFVVIAINAIAAPGIAWYLLAKIFNISLP